MFLVILRNPATYYLRRTVWTAEKDRASQYATRSEAMAALVAAKPFTNKQAWRMAQVVEQGEGA